MGSFWVSSGKHKGACSKKSHEWKTEADVGQVRAGNQRQQTTEVLETQIVVPDAKNKAMSGKMEAERCSSQTAGAGRCCEQLCAS